MPGIFESYIDSKQANSYLKRSIRDHVNDIDGVFRQRFEGKLYSHALGVTKRAARDLLVKVAPDPDDWEQPFVNLKGKGRSTRDAFVALVEKEVQYAMSHFFPADAEGPVVSEYATLVADGNVLLRRDGIDALLTDTAKKKVAAIYDYGNTYGGHGPTTALGPGVLHAHANDGDGIAFKFDGSTLEIVAYGTKSDTAPPGTSGYSWNLG